LIDYKQLFLLKVTLPKISYTAILRDGIAIMNPQQETKKRGRPASGNALTPAEKQRTYRARLKEKESAKEFRKLRAYVAKLEQFAHTKVKEVEALQAQVIDLQNQINFLKAHVNPKAFVKKSKR